MFSHPVFGAQDLNGMTYLEITYTSRWATDETIKTMAKEIMVILNLKKRKNVTYASQEERLTLPIMAKSVAMQFIPADSI